VDWRSLSWAGSQPNDTAIAFETRTSGDTINWSTWQAVDDGGGVC